MSTKSRSAGSFWPDGYPVYLAEAAGRERSQLNLPVAATLRCMANPPGYRLSTKKAVFNAANPAGQRYSRQNGPLVCVVEAAGQECSQVNLLVASTQPSAKKPVLLQIQQGDGIPDAPDPWCIWSRPQAESVVR